jgi:hypothetical protein
LFSAAAAAILVAGCGGGSSLSGSGGTGGAVGGAGGPVGGAGGPVGGAGGSGGAGAAGSGGSTLLNSNKVDILLMVDNSSSMTEMQQKLYAQLPNFVLSINSNLPASASLHIGVVSSDMGAPGDQVSSIGCTSAGDAGQLQSMPRGTCTASSLAAGASYISNADMMPNYTDANLGDVLQCIALLGDRGCGFEHQLASIDRALGADGSPPPASNVGFLRPDAYLAIVMLTNEDDCSAPTDTTLYSLNGGLDNITNPLGPIANYRCNQFGHRCTDPTTGAVITPPLTPPSDAKGTATAPTLNLTNCVSNDTTGMLTPVSKLINDIKALKTDPDNQIVVAAIAGPPSPYGVQWLPAQGGQSLQPGELWPQVWHSCGAANDTFVNPMATILTTDASFADPGVRIAQFVTAFKHNVLGSICDLSFAATMSAIAAQIDQLLVP